MDTTSGAFHVFLPSTVAIYENLTLTLFSVFPFQDLASLMSQMTTVSQNHIHKSILMKPKYHMRLMIGGAIQRHTGPHNNSNNRMSCLRNRDCCRTDSWSHRMSGITPQHCTCVVTHHSSTLSPGSPHPICLFIDTVWTLWTYTGVESADMGHHGKWAR